ncbi:hypothetical protein M9194_01340 [Vibrio sp. S4M6]|uniref:hypothetical protein n=1 Tax=Vibrio sinus TaxID=2946865 RepID=UPI002029BAC8|nr:hypothetical protein [Vibrio sinus]MCL9780072.1 hypothetical protein [Vibrio sinus]
MNNLKQALLDTHINQLEIISQCEDIWNWYCDNNQSLFDKACLNKPDSQPSSHLLGIATKQHIECLDRYTQQSESSLAMNQALENTLGGKENKFRHIEQEQLILTTHIWLYLQGYLGLDFSLSNDYAAKTANSIAQVTNQNEQPIRTKFLESYYMGTQLHRPQTQSSIIGWFKKLFGSY